MIEKVQWKINNMRFDRLEKLANWLTKRYWNTKQPEIARYITREHYLKEEARAGLL